MATWQVMFLVFIALLPFALMADFYPDRERLNARGRPLQRDWDAQIRHPDPDSDAH